MYDKKIYMYPIRCCCGKHSSDYVQPLRGEGGCEIPVKRRSVATATSLHDPNRTSRSRLKGTQEPSYMPTM